MTRAKASARPAGYFWIAACLLPPAWVFFLIRRLATGAPTAHQLSWVGFVEKIVLYRSLDWGFMFGYWGETRILPSKVAVALLAFVSGEWVPNKEQWVSPTLASLNLLLLCRLAEPALEEQPEGTRGLFALALSALTFSMTQWYNWFDPQHMAFYFSHAGFLGALLTLSRGRPEQRHWVGAASLCLLSSLSFPNGLLAWPAILPLAARKWRSRRPSAAAGLLGAALFLAAVAGQVYRYPVPRPEGFPDPGYGLSHPAECLDFFSFFMGVSLSPLDLERARLLSLLLIACFCSLFLGNDLRRRVLSERGLPWVCIFLFAAGSGVLAAVTRVSGGAILGGDTHYAVFSHLAWAAILALGYLAIPSFGMALNLCLLLVVISQVYFDAALLERWREKSYVLKQGLACLETYAVSTEGCLAKLSAPISGEFPRSLAPSMERLGAFKSFQVPSTAVYRPPRGQGYIDRISPSGKVWEATGWAILESCRPARHIVLTYGPRHTLLAHTAAVLPRPDVAQRTASCQKDSGWSVEFDPGPLLGGKGKAGSLAAWVYDEGKDELIQLEMGPSASAFFSRAARRPAREN